MNKLKKLRGRHSLITSLSMVFLVFGIGCMVYAMFNIWSQSGYFIGAIPNNYYTTTTVEELEKLQVNSTEPIKSKPLHVLPVPNKTLYALYPAEGDKIGSLTIPALNRKLSIIQGTGQKELKRGVGHFIQSVLPGEEDNCVISGHRDTTLRQVGNLKIGDELIVQTSAGTFTYEVNGTRIVHEDDKTVIVPLDHAVLTLTTCYPFNFIGSATDRYIISADLMKRK